MKTKIAVVVIPFFFFSYKELLHMYKTVSKNRANLGFYFHKSETSLQLSLTFVLGCRELKV